MKSKVLLAVVLCLFGFAAVAQQKKPRAAKPKKTSPATIAVVSEINTAGLKGLLSETKQRPLLVNFWATWCDPCRDEFPDLVKIDAEYRPSRIDFVTVSLDEVDVIKTDVPQFLDRMKATMPSYLLNVADPEPAINAVDPQWQGDLPATFLYNVQGELVFKHFGRVDTGELRAAIEKLVSSKP
jgi:thiol-disulfide isomerase/thioredoxin